MFLEQPLRLNVARAIRDKFFNRPILADNIFVYDEEMVSVRFQTTTTFSLSEFRKKEIELNSKYTKSC